MESCVFSFLPLKDVDVTAVLRPMPFGSIVTSADWPLFTWGGLIVSRILLSLCRGMVSFLRYRQGAPLYLGFRNGFSRTRWLATKAISRHTRNQPSCSLPLSETFPELASSSKCRWGVLPGTRLNGMVSLPVSLTVGTTVKSSLLATVSLIPFLPFRTKRKSIDDG